jgi:hypothetical protein
MILAFAPLRLVWPEPLAISVQFGHCQRFREWLHANLHSEPQAFRRSGERARAKVSESGRRRNPATHER